MKNNYILTFKQESEEISEELTETPEWCEQRFKHCDMIKKYSPRHAELVIHSFSGRSFSIDYVQMKYGQKQSAHLILPKNKIYLILMLNGSLSLMTRNGFIIGAFHTGQLYLAYSRHPEYLLSNIGTGSNLVMIVVGLRTKMIKQILKQNRKGSEIFPKLFSESRPTSVLPGSKVTGKHRSNLQSIYLYLNNSSFEYPLLDSKIMLYITEAIVDYFHLLGQTESSLIYLIRSDIEANFMNPNLNVTLLSEKYNISVRNLHKKFSNTFSQNINNYIIQCRLFHASKLLCDKHLKANDVYIQVGFNNIETFRYHYRKYYNSSKI